MSKIAGDHSVTRPEGLLLRKLPFKILEQHPGGGALLKHLRYGVFSAKVGSILSLLSALPYSKIMSSSYRLPF